MALTRRVRVDVAAPGASRPPGATPTSRRRPPDATVTWSARRPRARPCEPASCDHFAFRVGCGGSGKVGICTPRPTALPLSRSETHGDGVAPGGFTPGGSGLGAPGDAPSGGSGGGAGAVDGVGAGVIDSKGSGRTGGSVGAPGPSDGLPLPAGPPDGTGGNPPGVGVASGLSLGGCSVRPNNGHSGSYEDSPIPGGPIVTVTAASGTRTAHTPASNNAMPLQTLTRPAAHRRVGERLLARCAPGWCPDLTRRRSVRESALSAWRTTSPPDVERVRE